MADASSAPAVWTASQDVPGRMAQKGYIEELDGLRAFCAISVVAYHTLPTKLPGAFIGVDIFFVLSGFLISRIVMGEIDRTGSLDLLRFYRQRLRRLAPALCLMIYVVLAACGIAALALGGEPAIPLEDEQWSALFALAYVVNWTRAFSILPDSVFGHTWSLAIEQQFYLLWPLLLLGMRRFVRRENVWKAVLALLLAVVAWRTAMVLNEAGAARVYNGFDTRADSLMAGCLLAVAPLASLGRPAGRWIGVPVGILAALALVAHHDGPVSQSVGATAAMVCAAWLVLGIIERRGVAPLSTLLGWAPLTYLGRISYGIYLWHFPISLTVGQAFGGGLPNLAVTCVLSVLFGSLSFHLLEEPIRRGGAPSGLRDRFSPPGSPVPSL